MRSGLVVVGDDVAHLQAELMEIDENLCRAELTATQRTEFTKRRKQAWSALHPDGDVIDVEAKEIEVASSEPPQSKSPMARPQKKSFAAATEAATGQQVESLFPPVQVHPRARRQAGFNL